MSRHPWNAGYALPQNVLDEPLGKGVITTKWAKRGTVGSLGSLGSHEDGVGSLGGHSLEKSSLSGTTLKGTIFSGGSNDPVANFGRKGASLVMAQVRGVPKEFRKTAIRSILETIQPGLWEQVGQKARASQKKHGIKAAGGLEKALAATLANHYLSQLQELKSTGRAPRTGVMGLGAYPASFGACCSKLETKLAVSGWLSDVGSSIKKIGKKVVEYSPPGLAYKAGKAGVKYGKKGAEAAYKAGKKVFNGLGKLACKLAPMVGNAAGSSPDPRAQAAAQGAQMIQNLCSSPETAPYEPEATGGGGIPLMPILLIGGGIAAYFLLSRRG